MRLRSLPPGALGALLVATCLPLRAREAAAADKATLACIQSAEEGETARKAGQLLHARELFAQCAARECPKMLRHDCSSWLEGADAQIPSIVLGAHDAQGHDMVDARASVDGAVVRDHLDGNPIALDPGTHQVRFERAGLPPVEVQVVLRAGEKNRPILATLAPPAPPEPQTPPVPPPARVVAPPPPPPPVESSAHVPAGAWVLGGVGLVALGVFGYFGVSALNDQTTLRGTCSPGCSDSQVQPLRTKLIVADAALGVGVVALVAATWIGIRGLTRSPSAAAWDFVVAPSRSAASATFIVRF